MLLHVHQLHEVGELCVDLDAQLPSDIGTCEAPVHLDARVRKLEEEINPTRQNE